MKKTMSTLNFNGQIDDVKIFNYALTANQVKTLYNQGSAIQFTPGGARKNMKIQDKEVREGKGSKGDVGSKGEKTKYNQSYKAGYEYLLAYKLTIPIHDYTIEFCQRCETKQFPRLSSTRTFDQMIQAGRSGSVNIAEGYQEEGLKGYIKLAGVAKASQEELLKDYLAYARQHKLNVWSAQECKGKVREVRKIWEVIRATATLPDSPTFPNLPDNPEATVNLMVTLINQAIYLIGKLIASLKDKHMREGGLTEELYKKRIEYRKNMDKTKQI